MSMNLFPFNPKMAEKRNTIFPGRVFELCYRVVLFAVFLFPAISYADYEVFDLNPVPANQPIGSVNAWQMVGMPAGGAPTFVEYLTDATVTQFDRVTLPLCRAGGANGGEIYLEVRSTATSGPIVASSSLAVNSGNVWSTGCTSSIINATTSTFVLNQNVQWLTGGTFYFVFRAVGTTGTFYLSFDVDDGSNGKFLGGGASPPTWLGDFYWTSMQGLALGIPPAIYNASSSIIVCEGILDIDCQIGRGFAFLFVPSDASIAEIQAISLASTSPFGYGYELTAIVSDIEAGTTTPYSYVLDLTSVQTQLQTIVPSQTLGTTSVELFNVCWVDTKTGNAYTTYIMPFLKAAYALLALGILYLIAHSFFS